MIIHSVLQEHHMQAMRQCAVQLQAGFSTGALHVCSVAAAIYVLTWVALVQVEFVHMIHHTQLYCVKAHQLTRTNEGSKLSRASVEDKNK